MGGVTDPVHHWLDKRRFRRSCIRLPSGMDRDNCYIHNHGRAGVHGSYRGWPVSLGLDACASVVSKVSQLHHRLVGHLWMAGASCGRWVLRRCFDRGTNPIESRHLRPGIMARDFTPLGHYHHCRIHQHGRYERTAQDRNLHLGFARGWILRRLDTSSRPSSK